MGQEYLAAFRGPGQKSSRGWCPFSRSVQWRARVFVAQQRQAPRYTIGRKMSIPLQQAGSQVCYHQTHGGSRCFLMYVSRFVVLTIEMLTLYTVQGDTEVGSQRWRRWCYVLHIRVHQYSNLSAVARLTVSQERGRIQESNLQAHRRCCSSWSPSFWSSCRPYPQLYRVGVSQAWRS